MNSVNSCIAAAYLRTAGHDPQSSLFVAEPGHPPGIEEIGVQVVEAANSGAAALHVLAWEFPPWGGGELEEALAELTIPVRLVRIPREVLEPHARGKALFVEAALVDAALIAHPGGAWDVRLTRFRSGLPLDAGISGELRSRAATAGFDFLTYWAIDFDFQGSGQPFKHQWNTFRTPRDRSLKLQSAARWRLGAEGTGAVAVKVVDVFGFETTTLAVRPAGGSPGPEGEKR